MNNALDYDTLEQLEAGKRCFFCLDWLTEHAVRVTGPHVNIKACGEACVREHMPNTTFERNETFQRSLEK